MMTEGLPVAFDSGQKSPCRGCDHEEDDKKSTPECKNCPKVSGYQDERAEAKETAISKAVTRVKNKMSNNDKTIPPNMERAKIPPNMEMAKKRGWPLKEKPNNYNVTVDFTDYLELQNQLIQIADEEVRTIEQQIIYCIKKYLAIDINKTERG